jgi:hypothetical protein
VTRADGGGDFCESALVIAARAPDHGAMAGPIALAAALSRLVEICCPWCRKMKLVEREPKQFRICPYCHKRFPDPLQSRKR